MNAAVRSIGYTIRTVAVRGERGLSTQTWQCRHCGGTFTEQHVASRQAIVMNGVPICGRCFNALRAKPARGQGPAHATGASSAPVAGQSPVLPDGLLPALVPFNQAAVPMEQVFQSGSESEEQQPASRTPPIPSSRDSARRTGRLPEPSTAGGYRQVYRVGGISAAVSFAVVLFGYVIICKAKVETVPSKKPTPYGSPSVPEMPSPVDPAKATVTRTPQEEFDAIEAMRAEDKAKRMAALKAFVEKQTDPILVARARSEYEKLGGVWREVPIDPAKTELVRKAPGLLAEYFKGRDLKNVITRQVDLQICLDMDGIRPSGVPRVDFSVRWQGYLYVDKEGSYTIFTNADDGVRVKLNEQTIISNWGDHPAVRDERTVVLNPGYHALVVEYYQGGGFGEMALRWALKGGFDECIITADHLFHEGTN